MNFLSIIVLCFLFLQAIGRPTHVLQDYKYSKESSYRDSDTGDSDDYINGERRSSLQQFSAPKAQLQDETGSNEEVDHARSDKEYLENNDEDQGDATHLSRDDESMSNIKRTAAYGNGISLFNDNQKLRKVETNEYNEEEKIGPSQHARYLNQYKLVHNVDKDAINRDRRQITNSDNEAIGTEEISTQKDDLNANERTNEDEETAIRRHVKKLSKEELDELLHSLSDDKRELLKNIIDNCQQDNDSINKREITKKGGVNEENSLVGNEQSDTSKLQGGSANLEAESSLAPNSEKQESTKKPDTESMPSKSTENIICSEKPIDKINALDSIADKKMLKSEENLESSEVESKMLGNVDSAKETSKKEKKREINSKSFLQSESIIRDPTVSKPLNNEESYCSENEELSQLWNEESSLYNNNKYKREVCPDELDAIKSLEESFPNVDDPNNFKLDSNVPLIRVKRNNLNKVVEKRDAPVLSNLKVPYFSSALENTEEGNDEGGEFQDDGFFDRGTHLANSGELAKRDISKDNRDDNIKYSGNSQPTHIDNTKLETDTAGLGSDTDVILSGVEGVDDNMMYNGVARIRRTDESFDNLNTDSQLGKFKLQNKQQLNLRNEGNEISEEDSNAARYQENEAFGSLPRNYEQDLGRFKRIRRLKQENNVSTAK